MPRRWRKFWKWANGLAKSVRVPGSACSMACSSRHELALARGGRHVVAHVVVEDDQAGGVALLRCAR